MNKWTLINVFNFLSSLRHVLIQGAQETCRKGWGEAACAYINGTVELQDSELMKRCFGRADVVRIRIKAICHLKMLRAVKRQHVIKWNTYICVVYVHSEAYKT
jgi:hypothetical protein